jgi:nucleoid-associated protein YgaU
MPSVTVTVPGNATPSRVQAELTLVNTSGGKSTVVVLPITDPAASFKGLEADWEQVTRPGRKPILARVGEKLTTLDLKVTVAAPDGGRLDPGGTVEATLTKLVSMAGNDTAAMPVALTWGAFDTSANVTQTGRWHFQSFEIDSETRQPGTNNISRADLTITLVEASDAPTASSSALPAWTKPPAAPAGISTARPAGSITVWTVSQGDTVYKIAAAVYGNPEPGWRTILDANNITNTGQLTPGLILTIPPKPTS